jgi:hypothetical protein
MKRYYICKETFQFKDDSKSIIIFLDRGGCLLFETDANPEDVFGFTHNENDIFFGTYLLKIISAIEVNVTVRLNGSKKPKFLKFNISANDFNRAIKKGILVLYKSEN